MNKFEFSVLFIVVENYLFLAQFTLNVYITLFTDIDSGANITSCVIVLLSDVRILSLIAEVISSKYLALFEFLYLPFLVEFKSNWIHQKYCQRIDLSSLEQFLIFFSNQIIYDLKTLHVF